MANEMPKSEDLIKDRENLQKKVANIQAQKNKDIEARVSGIENNRDETKKLGELLEEARKNCNYYEELNKTGQLPEDEMDNFEKAKQIFWEIQAKIDEHDKAAKSAMAIPDVKDKVMEHAGETNKRFNEEKAKQEKEKIMEEKFSQWYEKIADLAEELNKKQEEARDEYEKARNNLIKKVDETIYDKDAGEALKYELKYFYVNVKSFKEQVARHKQILGWSKFSEKKQADSLINSSELREMETAFERFNKFVEENNLKGYEGKGLRGCMNAILNTNNYGMTQEITDLFSLSFEEPYVNSHTMVERAYNKDKQRFEKAGLEPNQVINWQRMYGERLEREKMKKK